ncbi:MULTISPECIES: DUF1127 domain-containing protein [unclassified Rhizobium]|uniref:DUF1127 domain-containing protein n=1 Tax=unclassified Rhizobium TaxID=2613769 RepID=UPI001ADC131D|nr:DUF1127 domain-containing protein [Rhizobium sp. 16-488-2b]MBO9173627.1 DUF1127 domain-containing protein [Rhizobium sp. 16-488-2a]
MATDTSDERASQPRVAGLLATLAEAARNLMESIETRCRKRRGRAALSELSDDELKDIGVSRSDAMTEAARSAFWG